MPVAYAHREIIVKGSVDEGLIVSAGEEIARHRRCYETADFVFNPLHDLPLLAQKVGALDQAFVGQTVHWTLCWPSSSLQGRDLQPEFGTLRRLPEARLNRNNRCAAGKRAFVQVLRLMEAFAMGTVHAAVKDALRMGAISADAVRHLVLARIEGRPARLDTGRYPHLPVANVGKTRPADDTMLMAAI